MKFITTSLLAIMFLATAARAEMPSPVVPDSACQCATADTPWPTLPTQIVCTLDLGLHAPVFQPGVIYRISYAIFGNALSKVHDGATAWVSIANAYQTYIGIVSNLAPDAVAPLVYYGGIPHSGASELSASQDVDLTGLIDGPADVTVNVAYNRDNRGSNQYERQEWGCHDSRLGTPSTLTIEAIP